jgi:hypothetical protein
MEQIDRELRRLLRTYLITTEVPREGRQRLLDIASQPSPKRLAVQAQAHLEAVTRPAIGFSESRWHRNGATWWLEIGIRV